MLPALWWWLVVQVVAVCALPLSLALFRPLADRGYGLSKALALLLFGYVTWLLVTSGLLVNGLPALGLTLLLLTAGSALVWRREGPALVRFWHRRRGLLLLEEGIFLATYLGFLFIRSYNPEISGTEKFMDFAFMNAVTRSATFPPLDPWLAPSPTLPHPTINYYYFGYLIQGLLLQLTNVVPGAVPPATAFNLALGLLFGLAATGSFSLGYGLARDLVAEGRTVRGRPGPQQGARPAGGRATERPEKGPVWSLKAAWPYVGAGLLAIYLLLIAGNLWTALRLVDGSEMWDKDFWQGIGWNATRVLVIKAGSAGDGERDVDYTINEFPSFSFLLGDLHPHVLSLPFVLLAVGLAYRWLLAPPRVYRWALTGSPALSPPDTDAAVTLSPGRGRAATGPGVSPRRAMATAVAELLPGAVVLGSLYFLNSWDFPAYFLLAQGAGLAGAWWEGRWKTGWGGRTAVAVALVGVLSLASVAPFLLTFRPPVVTDGGRLPLGLVTQRSLLSQFLQFWGAQLLLLAPPLLAALAVSGAPQLVRQALGRPLRDARAAAIVVREGASGLSASGLSGNSRLALLIGGGIVLILLAERAQAGVLLLGSALAGAAGWVTWRALHPAGSSHLRSDGGRPLVFACGAISLAALLLVACEVVYIRDIYGGPLRRMNTVFKFYYQAWLLFAIGGSAATFWLLRRLWQRRPAGGRGVAGRLAGGAYALVLLAMALFPYKATLLRTDGFGGRPTLDGMAWLSQAQPEDRAAAEWLRRHGAAIPGRDRPGGPGRVGEPVATGAPVVLEATGGPYSEFARVATQTGSPTVLGWDQHERLWRGAAIEAEITARQRDVETIYSAATLEEVRPLLDKYVVAYVVVGYLERQKYGPSGGLAKFETGGPGGPQAVFRQGRTAVYRIAGGASAGLGGPATAVAVP